MYIDIYIYIYIQFESIQVAKSLDTLEFRHMSKTRYTFAF